MIPPEPFLLQLLHLLADGRFWLMAAYAVGAALFFLQEIRSPAKSSGRLAAFVILSLATLLVLRAPSIFFNAPLDADEAEMLAEARKFTLGMNSWQSVDTLSHGPLDCYVLMWPELLGRSSSFVTARLTSLALLFAAWLAILRLPGRGAVRIGALAPVILLLGGTRMSEYLQYSSEVLPLSIMAVVMSLQVGMIDRPLSMRRAAALAVLIGAVPFAKLQATLPALFLGLALVWLVARAPAGQGVLLRRLAIVVAAALVPAALILGPLALSGGLIDFWNSYVGFALGYMQGGLGKIEDGDFRTLLTLLLAPDNLTLGFYALMAALAAIGVALNRAALLDGPSPARAAFGLGLGFFVTSLIAVFAPQRAFSHYAALLFMPVAAVVVLSWGLEAADGRPGRVRGRAVRLEPIGLALMLFMLVGAAATGHRTKSVVPDFAPDIMAPETLFGSGDLIADLPRNDRRVFIWGWMGEWLVQSAAMPATREMLTYNQTQPGPLRQYFRERMMSDLRLSAPRLIFDAAAPGSFYYHDAAKEGLQAFPELKAFIDANYVQVSRSRHGDICPRTYIRKDAFGSADVRYAKVASVSASAVRPEQGISFTPDHLVDGIVFEICPDGWLLPDHKPGWASLQLATPQVLGSVEILNIRGGFRGDRATRSVRITGWDGARPAWVQRVNLQRYPYWSRVPAPAGAGPVSRVTIAVESFAGVGGGLNEVRLVRAGR